MYIRLYGLSRSVIDDFVGLNVIMHVMLCCLYSVLGRCSDTYKTFHTNKQSFGSRENREMIKACISFAIIYAFLISSLISK